MARDHWRSSRSLPAQAGFSRACYSELCPNRFWISPGRLHNLTGKFIAVLSNPNSKVPPYVHVKSCVPVSACGLLSYCLSPLRRAQFMTPSIQKSKYIYCAKVSGLKLLYIDKIPLSLLLSRLNQVYHQYALTRSTDTCNNMQEK